LLQTAVDRRNPAYVASFVDADAPMRTTAIMAGVADALARRRPSGIVMLIDDWPPAGAPQIVKGLSARYPDAAMKTLRMPRDMAEVSAVVRGAKGPLAVVALGQIGTRTLLAALSGTGDRPAAVVVSPNDAAATELLARSLADVAVGPGLCAMANAAVEAAAKAAEHDVAVVRPSVTVTVRTVSAPGRAGATCR
jgi:hypothetical protein